MDSFRQPHRLSTPYIANSMRQGLKLAITKMTENRFFHVLTEAEQ